MPITIKDNVHTLVQNPALLKKYNKEDLGIYFEQLIKQGDVEQIDCFLKLPFPKNKEVGLHVWNKKSNAMAYYENYALLALTSGNTKVFEYFQQQHSFTTNTIFDRLSSENNLEMIDYILNYFPPTNIRDNTHLLFSAMDDDFVEQFKLLLTHPKNPVSSSDNERLLKNACVYNKPGFIIVLMIDCKMTLSDELTQWLAGNNTQEAIFDYPGKLVILRELNQKLNNTMPKKQSNSVVDKFKKI